MPPFSPRLLLAASSLLVVVVVLLLPPPLATADDTVYDVLRQHGLPMGLLPKGVRDFKIDADGNFDVWLDKPCTARFENDVRYEANVSGTIGYGQIGALKGISAQELFLWLPVKGIRVDVPSSGVIYFDVGVIFKQFSLSLFEVPPECHDEGGNGNEVRVLLREGEEIARVVSEGKSRKPRYDNEIKEKASM